MVINITSRDMRIISELETIYSVIFTQKDAILDFLETFGKNSSFLEGCFVLIIESLVEKGADFPELKQFIQSMKYRPPLNVIGTLDRLFYPCLSTNTPPQAPPTTATAHDVSEKSPSKSLTSFLSIAFSFDSQHSLQTHSRRFRRT
jgi:hypothetical protein